MVSLSPAGQGRLLVVDDDAVSLRVLELQVTRLGFEVICASSLNEALALLRENQSSPLDAMLTDYWMPGGTGLDLLRASRAIDPTLAVVIMSAAGDKNVLSDALQIGASGFLDKPVKADSLAEQLVRAIEATRTERKGLEAARIAEELGRSQSDLMRYQSAKLGDRLQVHYRPFDSVSGDFLSVFHIDDDNFVILASDTSGHDMKSAYQSSYFHGLARGILHQGGSVEQVFHFSNKMLLENLNREQVTISLGAIAFRANLQTMRIQYLNAGFPFPYLVDGEGFASPMDAEPTNPLGWFPDIARSHIHTLPLGHVIFWSDGVDDLADRMQVDPLALACRLCQPGRDKSKLTLRTTDDIVVVRASFGHDSAVSTQPFAIISQEYSGSDLPAIDTIQSLAENSLRLAIPGISEEKLAEIVICLREALINALKHGCKGRADMKARLKACCANDLSEIQLRIADDGPGYHFDQHAHADVAAEHLLTEHRGLLMISSLPTNTYFSGKGSVVTMNFKL